VKTEGSNEKSGLGVVFNPDLRVRINPTTVEPYYWIGQLEIGFPGDKKSDPKWQGTGTLIGSNLVLTCAHNLYDAELGGYATAVTFYPGRNGQSPGTEVTGAKWVVPDEYIQSPPPQPSRNGTVNTSATQYLFDFGLVWLSKELHPEGEHFPGMYAATDNELAHKPLDIAGYPVDKALNTMWNCGGNLHSGTSDELLFYEISTYGGQSGAAVRALFPKKNPSFPDIPWIVGIHVAGKKKPNGAPDINFAVRLNQDIVNRILGWMQKQT
jgi:glutamyl endopeptidase